MVIAEALGHALVVEPYVDTVVVAGGLLLRAGGPAATALLEKHRRGHGDRRRSPPPSRASGDHWQDVATTADRDGDGWVLAGSKIVAIERTAGDAPADHRAHGRRALAVPRRCRRSVDRGLEMHGYRTVDDRRAADLVFDELRLPADALLGEEGQAWPSLAQARDEGAAAVCAEAVGCMRKVLADTVEYCKQRQQFGQPIGSFQVLQHRMVDMHMELEQAVAAVYLAVLNLEAEPDARARAVSAAKATIGRAARFVGQNAVQLHGGMGMTEELAIGHYFKRLTALQYEFGSTDHHVDALRASCTREVTSLAGWLLFARDERHLGHPLSVDQDRGRGCLGARAGLRPRRRRRRCAAAAGVVPAAAGDRAQPLEGPCWSSPSSRSSPRGCCSRTPNAISSSLTGLLIAASPIIAAVLDRLTGGERRLGGKRIAGLAVGICRGRGAGRPAHRRERLAGHRSPDGRDVLRDRSAGRGALPRRRPGAADDRSLPRRRRGGVRGSRGSDLADGDAVHARALGVGGLAVICTALAFIVFFALIREVGAARALVFTYVNPAVALAAGVIVLHEPLTPWNVAALALILAGCVLATRRHTEHEPDIVAEATAAPR